MLTLLPTCFALLLFLSLQIFALRGDERLVQMENRELSGHMRLLGNMLSVLETAKFQAIPEDPTAPKKNRLKSLGGSRTKAFESPRDLHPLSDTAKLNLCFLAPDHSFTEKATLLQIAQNLLKLLYQRAYFYQEGMEKTFLEAIVEGMRKYPDATCFEELLKDVLHLPFVHKILKGTSTYTLKSSEGYPPFTAYFAFMKQSNRPLLFPHTARLILSAILGEEMVDKIIAAEKQKWEAGNNNKFLTQAELTQIIPMPSSLQAQFSFSRVSRGKQKTIIEDEKTKIRTELDL